MCSVENHVLRKIQLLELRSSIRMDKPVHKKLIYIVLDREGMNPIFVLKYCLFSGDAPGEEVEKKNEQNARRRICKVTTLSFKMIKSE